MRHPISVFLLSAALVHSQLAMADGLTALEAASRYEEQTSYTIFRKGKPIGKHILSINANDDQISIDIDSKITVRVLKIPVFKFRYQSTEKWQDNKLKSVESSTKTNKDIETASLNNSNGESQLRYQSNESTSALVNYATNHWHIGAVSETNLFNTIKGTNSQVVVTALGKETLIINGKKIETTHYQYKGDIFAESWYDDNQRWVKLAFQGSDDSTITYLIDKP